MNKEVDYLTAVLVKKFKKVSVRGYLKLFPILVSCLTHSFVDLTFFKLCMHVPKNTNFVI